jgi:hypothetical protein
VNVSDTMPPGSFSFQGPISIALECGSPYTDPGANAFDTCAGPLPTVPTGFPNPSVPGTYSYGYRATDPSGNTAFSPVLRTVSVLDTLPPTLTVLGPLDQVHECGSPYVDPGATAADVCAEGNSAIEEDPSLVNADPEGAPLMSAPETCRSWQSGRGTPTSRALSPSPTPRRIRRATPPLRLSSAW